MITKLSTIVAYVVATALLFSVGWAVVWLVGGISALFKVSDPGLRAAVLTGAITVIGSTLAVVIGRYLERRKEIEAHFREAKLKIYDEFLKELFSIFYGGETKASEADTKLVEFLREWQRKMVLWGGQGVLGAYLTWLDDLKKGVPTAKTVFLMEDFFREIRNDVGHRSWRIAKGSFAKLIIKDSELFLRLAKQNPNITLAEIAKVEESLGSAVPEKSP